MSRQTVYVQQCTGVNGLEKIILREVRGFSAEIYLYGGQVTSWKNDLGEELLFVSSKNNFKPPKSIRGGIPICFPQFSNHGSLQQHGFARNRFWSLDPNPPPFPTATTNRAFIDLILKHSEDDAKLWPHRIALGPAGDLLMTSRIRNTNTDGKSFTFTFAYNTYFYVTDIRSISNYIALGFMTCVVCKIIVTIRMGSEVRIEGLETLDYLDNLKNRERFTEQGDAITFESEVDKVYLSTPTKIAIIDHERKRTFVLRKDGLPDAVVWNPWDKKAKSISDLGDDEYKNMLCVQAACVENPITLKPGEEWKGRQEISPVPSSYCSGQLDPRKVLFTY
ncbi:hypothetical protein V8G54_000938 [Vigna mungo]|uniref:glucose-6-phosphate 1-epimerase n=1 Tax=Vigna mungo TaxID=3915 RepID=A0AAQ3P6P4_VIGMU